jgi:hypothetical protein
VSRPGGCGGWLRRVAAAAAGLVVSLAWKRSAWQLPPLSPAGPRRAGSGCAGEGFEAVLGDEGVEHVQERGEVAAG